MRARLLVLACLLAFPSSGLAQSFFDNFNRPDAADLGPNWTNVTGPATRVISNSAGNVSATVNLSLVTVANFSAPYTSTRVSADVFHSGTAGLAYVALAFGHNGVTAAGNGLHIKVQANSGALFDNVGFYTGANQGDTTRWTDPPVFFALTTPFASAHMTAWASDATTINVAFDTNFDSVDDQVYTRHLNLGTMTFGTQAGLAVFGTTATADNFLASVSAVPEPATVALGALAAGAVGGAVVRRRRRRRIIR